MNTLQQTKDNVIEKDKILIEDCECKSLFGFEEGFRCFDCGKEFEDEFGYKEKELSCKEDLTDEKIRIFSIGLTTNEREGNIEKKEL